MPDSNPMNNLLTISLTLSATPELFLVKSGAAIEGANDLLSAMESKGFGVQVEAGIPYEGLTAMADGYLRNKRFTVSEGLLNSHMIVQQVVVSGEDNGRLLIRVQFTGSFGGTIFFTGKPVINVARRVMELSELDYRLETSSFLLNTAKWLFPKKIFKEIEPYTSLDISKWLDGALLSLQEFLNQKWAPGVSTTGMLEDLSLSAQAQPQQVTVRIEAKGNIRVTVMEEKLGTKP